MKISFRELIQSRALPLETKIVAVALGIFLVLVLNSLAVICGLSELDDAAKAAARAAASTDSPKSAYLAAQEAASHYKTDGFFVSQPIVGGSPPPDNWTSGQNYSSTDFSYYTNVNKISPSSGFPYVVVTCRSNVRALLPPSIFGASISSGQSSYVRTYTFPLLGVAFRPGT